MALPSSIFLLVLFLRSIAAQNISVGTNLTASQNSNPWRSPNGDFAFGFQPLPANNSVFLLCIWFDKIPNKTIVWYERNPVPSGSTLRLDADGGLILRDPQGGLRYNTTSGGGRVAYAFMNDTGNFVLSRSDSTVLWESFRHPADTLLPTQTLEINDVLISRKREADFSPGRFFASISDRGNFVFNTKTVATNLDYDDLYYSSSTSSQNSSDAGVRVVFSSQALISVVRRNGSEQLLSNPSIPLPSDNYYRAVLDFDGVFRQYYHPKNFGNNQTSWRVAESWPNNICLKILGDTGSGACGYNSVCRMENGSHVCQCPQGFSLADPTNPYGDCMPKFVQSCIDYDDENYDLYLITNTDWPLNDYEQIKPSSEEECQSACLSDCFCGVAIFRDNSCWKKRLPLSNGKVEMDVGVKAFLKLRKTDIPSPNPPHPNSRRRDNSRQSLIVVISVLLGSSAFINLLLITAACVLLFHVYSKRMALLNPVRQSNLRCFTYKELVHATNGFNEELGRGAFGTVYKGELRAGNNIAVKKLDGMFRDSEKEFKAEVNAIGRTHHKNLVGLIGFCDEGPHRMLVYEYMSNGTLAAFLFGDLKPSWCHRTQIALGIAKGLTYLHEECSNQIIHCDIKPQNILLDEYYAARISDFGLAKLMVMNQSKTVTNIRGTKGYVAPEWFRNTQISVKVDVYSFGVVLLEIITCRKALEDLEFGEGENPILADWAWDCFMEGRLEELVRNDEEALRDGKMVERFIMVGLWCIQEDPSVRPTMMKACQMLQGIVEVPKPPIPSSFFYVV